MCGEIEEAVTHVLAARKMPAQKQYTNWRHDKTAIVIHSGGHYEHLRLERNNKLCYQTPCNRSYNRRSRSCAASKSRPIYQMRGTDRMF